MRKRWRESDGTPVSIQVTIAVFVIGWFVVVSWWEYEKYGHIWGDWYWWVEAAPFLLAVVVILVGWIVQRLRRGGKKQG